jgi:SprT protein
MTLAINLQNQAQQRLDFLFTFALTKPALQECLGVFKKPSLLFNQRGKIAGSALLQTNTIKLNAVLYTQNTDYFLSQVIAHELAHIMVYQLYGRTVRTHGIEWQKVMLEVFELYPKVTHSLDVSKVAMRTVTYACLCQQVPLSLIRHNRVVRGKQTYICRKCNTTLVETTNASAN